MWCMTLQVQIDHVKAHAEGIKTLTPTLIRVAKEVAEERSGKSLTSANKQLDILSHQWATKVTGKKHHILGKFWDRK